MLPGEIRGGRRSPHAGSMLRGQQKALAKICAGPNKMPPLGNIPASTVVQCLAVLRI